MKKKKLKKIDKNVAIIRELEHKIDILKYDLEYSQRIRAKLEKDLDEAKEMIAHTEGSVEGRIAVLKDANRTLSEIIRWQIKPSTTEHPFDSAISQKFQNSRNNTNAL